MHCTFSERIFLDVLSPASSQDSLRDLIRIETKSVREIVTRSSVNRNSVNLSAEQQSGGDEIGETPLDDSSTALVRDFLHCLVELLSFH